MFRCGRAIGMLSPMHYSRTFIQRQEKGKRKKEKVVEERRGFGLGIWFDVGG